MRPRLLAACFPALLFILIILTLGVVPADCQEAASSEMRGIVYDSTGAVVPGAQVSVVNPQTGVARAATTDSAGVYYIPSLRPAAYNVRVEASGFARQLHSEVGLTVGQVLRMDFHLRPGDITTEVLVTATPPAVEVEKTQHSDTIEQKRIDHLPINRRNYLDFALLTPGVTDSTFLVDDTDFRVVQTPQSGLSFAGGNGRRNFVAVDGVESQLNSGGVRATISQEAVQEFQINRSGYSAEFGQGSGGAVNIVTRSGSNQVRGNVFAFVRNKRFQARNYFDAEKAPYTRAQTGFTLGGPIRQNRTFFFTAFERLDRNEAARVPLLQDPGIFTRFQALHGTLFGFLEGLPTSAQTAALKGLGGQLKQALTTTNYPTTVSLFRSNSGIFPFKEDLSMFSIKLDHHFNENNQVFFRNSLADDFNQNSQFGGLIAFNRGRDLDTFDNTAVLGWTRVFGPTVVNEFRTQFGYNRLHVLPIDPNGPEINITGFGLFGREIFLPSRTIERHYQWLDNLTWTKGRHTLKFGGDVNPVQDSVVSETFFGGRFSFGEAVPLASVLVSAVPGGQGLAVLQQLNGLLTSAAAPATLRETAPFTVAGVGTLQLSRSLVTPITALQAYNLGLPTFYQQGFGDPNLTTWARRYALYAQDHWKVRPNLTLSLGLRYELDKNDEPLKLDSNNVGPRVGLAWDPFGNGRTAIRAGYGIYYSTIDAQVVNVSRTLDGKQIAQTFVPLTGLPGLVVPGTTTPVTSAVIFKTLLQQGVVGKRTITAQDLAQFGIKPGPNAPLSVVFGLDPSFANPYSQQAGFAIDQQVAGFAVSGSYVFNRTARVVRILDRNLIKTGTRADPRLPTYGFKTPLLNQLNIFESTANVFYHGFTAALSRRFARRYAAAVHYTFSKAIDETTDFNSDFQPNDQLNARADRALSSFDQRHRLVANAVIETPFQRGGGGLASVLADITVSPIVVASSGRPFNVLLGYDNVGDRHAPTHRPRGAGRNIGHGPDYFTADLRVSKRFHFSRRESLSVEVIGEAFNLLNRTNFRNVNNIVGCIGAGTGPFFAPDAAGCPSGAVENLPAEITGQRIFPTNPLAFTSTLDQRMFQLGLKISF